MVSVREIKRKGKKYKNGIAFTLDLTAKESEDLGIFPEGKGKRTWRGTYRTRLDAKEAIKHLEKETQNNSSKRNAGPTLAEVYGSWLGSTSNSESTKDLYRACWPHLEDLHDQKLTQISRSDIKQLLENLPFSKSRVKSIRTLLNHCFNQALDAEQISASPMINLKLKYKKPSTNKDIQYWTQEQANKLLNHYPKPKHDLFYRLALHTGCRRGELLALRWENVNFENNSIQIRATYDRQYGYREPKTEKSNRTIRLRQQETNLLKAANHPSLVYVFQRPGKPEPISINSIQKEFYKLSDALGLPHIGLHGLRHTNATLALQARIPVETLSKRLGHSTVTMTYETYRHIIPAEDQQLAETLGNALD